MDNNTEIKKVKKTRTKKEDQYKTERQAIITELNRLSGLDEKSYVILWDLEKNEELKQKLKELDPIIRRCYKYGSWGYYSKDKKKGMGHEIGLMKSIYKADGYKIWTKRKSYMDGDRNRLATELHFIKS